ncbi:MAG: hybrid sensor histidine kinase/response regulator [Chitinivibrionales bacterium]|nr:hybrid sensor histidine kinase/response regulator [Chitinivibrionales bacterium]
MNKITENSQIFCAETLSVLIVEDEMSHAQPFVEYLTDPILNNSFQVTQVGRLEIALQHLETQKVDVLLLDLFLPDSQGLETVAKVQCRFPFIPLIVLSDPDHETLAYASVKKGAQDYLMKSNTDAQSVLRVIRNSIARKKWHQVFGTFFYAGNDHPNTNQSRLNSIIQSITSIIAVPFIAFARIEHGRFKTVTQFSHSTVSFLESISMDSHPCGIFTLNSSRQNEPYRLSGKLAELFAGYIDTEADYCVYYGAPILNSTGTCVGVLCIMDDKPRELTVFEEETLENFRRHIGYEFERITAEQQVRESSEMQMIQQLTSGIVHEVRNPLNGILAITEALFSSLNKNSEYSPYIVHIKNQVNHLSALMRDLLELGKPLLPMHTIKQSLQSVVCRVVENFKQSCPHKLRTITITSCESAQNTMVTVDNEKIQQLFTHLLDNACDHSPLEAPIELRISPRHQDFVTISVIDHGVGIKHDCIEKVFKPFYSTKKGGTGLGLNIVKHIINIHGGSINLCETVPPPGLTVEVWLPVDGVPVSA